MGSRMGGNRQGREGHSNRILVRRSPATEDLKEGTSRPRVQQVQRP